MEQYNEDAWWADQNSMARVLSDSVRLRDQDIKPFLDLREMLVGPHFGGGIGDKTAEKPNNAVYAFYAHHHHVCLGGDLQCITSADQGSPEEPLALAYERAINETFRRGGGESIAEKVYGDMVCGYGAMLVTPSPAETVRLSHEERQHLHSPLGSLPWSKGGGLDVPVEPNKPAVDEDPMQPRVHYIDPAFLVWDRRAPTLEQAEFVGYMTTHDVLDLIEQAELEEEMHGETGWDLDQLRTVAEQVTDTKAANLGGRSDRSRAHVDPERRRISLWTILCKTAVLEGVERPEGHNEVAYVMWMPHNDSASGIWLKEPAYHFAPPWGSISLFYQHQSGEDSTPFSALTANKTKVVANDQIHAVAYRRIRRMKTNPVVVARNKAAIDRMEDKEDLGWVVVPDEGAKVDVITVGGLDAPTFAAVEYLDRQFARDLGLDPAGRGAAEGGGRTATESSLSASERGAKGAQFQRAFNRGVANVYRTIGWYIGHSAHFVVRADFGARAAFHEQQAQMLGMSEDESREIGRQAAPQSVALIQGGDFLMNPHLDFTSLRFDVNAYLQRFRSMEEKRMESAQFRADLAQILDLARMQPFFPWVDEIRQLEEDYGRRGVAVKVDASTLSLFAQAAIEGAQPEAAMSPAKPANEAGSAGPFAAGPRITMTPGAGPGLGRNAA